MDEEEKLLSFLRTCNAEYDTLMEAHFDSAETEEQLETHHTKEKEKLLLKLEDTWKQVVGDSNTSPKAKAQLVRDLDTAFELLKKFFIRSKQKSNSIQIMEKILKQYTAEIDKYFDNNPNATREDIETQHVQKKTTAIKMLRSSYSKVPPKIQETLQSQIETHHETYKQRAELNELSMENLAIGIDLGTTMCCVMIYRKGKIEVVQNRGQHNARTTPSYVCFHEDDTDTFGHVAKDEAYRYPETTIFDAKRMIGRQWGDKHLMEDMKKWPFKLVSINKNAKIVSGRKTRFPQEVSARLLARFRRMTEEYLGLSPGRIRKAVITVPAYFSEPQRRATREAAECAGLEVLNIISEPTAAVLAYNWERIENGARNVLVYDLGGGTFDVACARVEGKHVEILAVNGNTHLGGRDFDQQLMDYCMDIFYVNTGINLKEGLKSEIVKTRAQSKQALSRLRLACERTKEALSTSKAQKVVVERIWEETHLEVEISVEIFEDIIRPTLERTLKIVKAALEDVTSKGVPSKESIDDILLIGGATRVPLVSKMVREFFGGKELCMHINPDEAVAYGAAVQAAISNKSEAVKDLSVQDVTPFSLGIFVIGNIFSVVIPKNTKIPCKKSENYNTVDDFQQTANIQIYQGEDMICSNNEKIGCFKLDGFRSRPGGMESCEVSMEFDENGILEVSAKSSLGSSSIKISSDRLGMDAASIARVKRECAANIMEDEPNV